MAPLSWHSLTLSVAYYTVEGSTLRTYPKVTWERNGQLAGK